MWSLLLSAVLAVSSAPVVCQNQDSEAYTLVGCSAKGVATWSAVWASEEGGAPQRDLVTVQATGRCGWFQLRSDHTSPPRRVCPDRGDPQACVIRQTLARCRR